MVQVSKLGRYGWWCSCVVHTVVGRYVTRAEKRGVASCSRIVYVHAGIGEVEAVTIISLMYIGYTSREDLMADWVWDKTGVTQLIKTDRIVKIPDQTQFSPVLAVNGQNRSCTVLWIRYKTHRDIARIAARQYLRRTVVIGSASDIELFYSLSHSCILIGYILTNPSNSIMQHLARKPRIYCVSVFLYMPMTLGITNYLKRV